VPPERQTYRARNALKFEMHAENKRFPTDSSRHVAMSEVVISGTLAISALCPVSGNKRTLKPRTVMAASCQKQTSISPV
jgi:hypothetical protein